MSFLRGLVKRARRDHQVAKPAAAASQSFYSGAGLRPPMIWLLGDGIQGHERQLWGLYRSFQRQWADFVDSNRDPDLERYHNAPDYVAPRYIEDGDGEGPIHRVHLELGQRILPISTQVKTLRWLGPDRVMRYPYPEDVVHLMRSRPDSRYWPDSNTGRGVTRVQAYPDIVVGAGRSTAATAVALRRYSKGHTLTVQLMDPRCDSRLFDMVVVPEHDIQIRGNRPSSGYGSGSSSSSRGNSSRGIVRTCAHFFGSGRNLHHANVVPSMGVLTDISPSALQQYRLGQEYADVLQEHPQLAALLLPRSNGRHSHIVAVLVGGSSKHVTFTPSVACTLVQRLTQHLLSPDSVYKNCRLLVTLSRRTPEDVRSILHDGLAPYHDRVWMWNGQGVNPYRTILTHADASVVTADSISMLCDSVSTGLAQSTYVALNDELNTWSDRHAAFVQSLFHGNLAHRLEDGVHLMRPYDAPVLGESDRIANALLQRYKERIQYY